jgi:RHS repeat-associated protein
MVRPLLISLAVAMGMTQPFNSPAQIQRQQLPHAMTNTPDTTVVFGPTTYTRGSSGTWTVFASSFSISGFDSTKRYIFRITNGSGGSNRVAEMRLYLNSSNKLSSTDITTSIGSATVVVAPNASNTLQVEVRGTTGTYVVLNMICTPDPSYLIYGPTQFDVPPPPEFEEPDAETELYDTIYKPSGAVGPYTMIVDNGAPNGSARTNGRILLNSTQVITSSELNSSNARIVRQVPMSSSNSLDLILTDYSTYANVSITATDTTPPIIAITAPADTVTKLAKIAVGGTVTDETVGTISVNAQGTIATPGAFSDSVVLATDGRYSIGLHAVNRGGYGRDAVRKIVRDTRPPTLNLSTLAATTADSSITVGIGWHDSTLTVVSCDGVTAGSAPQDTTTYAYALDFGPNRITVRAVDAAGNSTSAIRYVLRTLSSDTPISAPTASTLSGTEITPFRDRVAFLFTGGSPVQTGAVADSITAARATVLRGRVVARDIGAIPNVTVRVLGHPEFGQTKTRSDGAFDLVVNGGGIQTLRFTKLGYLEAQRQIDPLLNTFHTLDDVAMIGRSARFAVVDLESPQVVRSRFATDANGDRDLRLFFPGSLRARVSNPITAADSEFRYVRVRATEYTQGSEGPAAMPAMLPAGSAYTYCVELSLDEADSLANYSGEPKPVRFTQPVSCYVRNFLGYPVGSRVPLGSFDRTAGHWVAEDNAVVIKVVGAAGDTALIDSNGDNTADGSTLLDSLGISVAERRTLLAEYGVNGVLWRARLNHFTPGDLNPNSGPPQEQLANGPRPLSYLLKLLFGPCLSAGSIIECENRVLGERLPITGTPYTLNYRSMRAPGDAQVRSVYVPVIGDTIPPTLLTIRVSVEAAGKVYSTELERTEITKNMVVPVTWDGLDVYGRHVEGSVNAQVSVGYGYGTSPVWSMSPKGFGNSATSGRTALSVTADRNVQRFIWTRRTIALGVPSTGSDGLGGWTISPHHVFDPNGRGAVYYGSGEVDPGDRIPMSRWTVAVPYVPNGACPDLDGSVISSPGLDVTALALAPDGSLYFADACRGSIYRLGKDHVAHRLAGTGTKGNFNFGAVGGSSRSAPLRDIDDIVLAPDGSFYFAARTDVNGRSVICQVTASGTLNRLIGDGAFRLYGQGDDGPVSSATTVTIQALALGPDGSLFFSESGTHPDNTGSYSRVRRIATDGTISAFAGSVVCTSNGSIDSTGLASAICMAPITDLAVDAGGTLFVLEGEAHRLRRITPEGRLSTFTSLQNTRFTPSSMGLAPDGSIYLTNGAGSASQSSGLEWHGVYRVDPDGNLSQIGGGVGTGTTYEGAPVTTVPMLDVTGIAVLPDASYYVVTQRGIQLVTQRFATEVGNEWMVPDESGSEMYFFSKTGRHLRTRDALTGTLRYWFDYDATFGDLTAIHDGDGGTTTIVRNSTTRVPEKIQAPDGQETVLALTTGSLTRVEDPGGNATVLAYASGGLLSSLTNPNSDESVFAWDATGRLTRDTDPAGGFQELTVDSLLSRIRVIWRETALGRDTRYRTAARDDGTSLRQVTDPAGLVTNRDLRLDTSTETVLPGGTVVTEKPFGDPRFSLVAPVPASTVIRLPSGLTRSAAVTRPYSATTFNPPTSVSTAWVEQTILNGSDSLVTQFDAANHRFTAQRSLARRTTVTVDTAGRPIAVYLPGLDTLRRSYDARGRLVEVRQGSRGWRLSYDSRGRVAVVRDTLGRMTTYGYDTADRPTTQTLPGNRSIALGYDAVGNLKTLTPPGQPPHRFDYTTTGLTGAYRPPGAGMTDSLTEYTHNLDGQLTEELRPDGTSTALTYGSTDGRITQMATPRGNVDFTYDGAGRLSTLGSPDGVTLTYGYNGALDTLESWSGSMSGAVSVIYDQGFRVSSRRVNGDSTVNYRYDHDGLLSQAGALYVTRSVDNGLVTGTALSSTGLTTIQTYNAFGEPSTSLALLAADTLWSAVYSRDALGRIEGIDEDILGSYVSRSYAYSDTGFLKTATVNGAVTERYRYDLNGNRIAFDSPTEAVTATYDTQDRLLQYGTTIYRYSADGKLVMTIAGTDTTQYTYDAFTNLIRVRFQNRDSIKYQLDGRNRRVSRTLNNVVTQRWVYEDQLAPAAEINGSGQVVARYVYGTRNHIPDYVVKGDTTYRIISDHLGSVRLVINAATGKIAQRIDYDGYGRITYDSKPGFQCFGFAGGLYDPGTGLDRFGARDYDPRVGRWLARDPSGFAGGDANVFSYARNNPINLIDPSGLIGFDVCGLHVNASLAATVNDWTFVYDMAGIKKENVRWKLTVFTLLGASVDFDVTRADTELGPSAWEAYVGVGRHGNVGAILDNGRLRGVGVSVGGSLWATPVGVSMPLVLPPQPNR